VLIPPAIATIVYLRLSFDAAWLPEPRLPAAAPLLLLVFLAAAIGEEVGWSGYALDPLQRRGSALAAALLIGVVWGLAPRFTAGGTPRPGLDRVVGPGHRRLAGAHRVALR
jgi:membrane protease YdiL (CAAX protease family)